MRFLLDCWNDVGFHVSPQHCNYGLIFSILNHILLSMTVTGSFLFSSVSLSVFSLKFCVFWVAVLIAFCLAVTFTFGELILVFPFSVGLSSDSNVEQRFLVSIDFITLDGLFFKRGFCLKGFPVLRVFLPA